MSMKYKRSTRETETYSILKSGKKKNTNNFSDDDSIPTKELIDKIDTELKHLIGQRKILQRAKEGKSYRHTVSSKVFTNNRNKCKVNCSNLSNMLQRIGACKTIKVADSSTQIECPLRNLNSKRIRREVCKNGHVHKYTNENSNVGQKETIESYDTSINTKQKIYMNRSPVEKVHFIETKTNSTNKNTQTCQNINNQKLRKAVAPELNFIRHSKKLVESTKSPKNDKPKKCQKFQKNEDRNLEKTKSSIRRHAKLSEEILNYAKHRSNRYEHKTKLFGQKLKTQNNNLNETLITWQSHNVSTIKPTIIDDSTYTCPNNSEENSYLIIPYIGNTSKEKEYSKISVKPTKEFLNYRESFVKETTSRSDVLLESPSLEIEREPEENQISHEFQLKKDSSSQKIVNQEINRKSKLFKSSNNYDSHDLETTWESHANREAPLSSKFDTSQNNRTKITSSGYRLDHHYSKHPIQSLAKQTLNLKKKSIYKKDISKPFLSNQNYTNKYSPTKLSPETKQKIRMFKFNQSQKQSINGSSGSSDSSSNTKKSRCSTQSFSNNVLVPNQAFPISSEKLDLPVKLLHPSSNTTINSETKNSLTSLSWQNEKSTNSFGSGRNASSKISVEVPKLKKNEEFAITLKPHKLLESREVLNFEALETSNKDNINFQQATHLKMETSTISKESSSNLNFSDTKILQQKSSTEEIKNYGLVPKSLDFKAGVISKENIHIDKFSPENYLNHKSCTLPVKDKDLNGLNESTRSNTSELGAISAKTKEYGVMSKQVDSDRRSHNLVSVTGKFKSNSKLNDYDTSINSKTSSNEKEKSLPKSQNVSRKISPKINSSSTDTSLKYQPKNHKVDEELLPQYSTQHNETSFSILAQCKTQENPDISKKSPRIKPKPYASFSTFNEKEKPESISKLFRSTLNGSELGAIPKHIPNEKKLADELTKRRTKSNNESMEPNLKQTNEAISKSTKLNTSESDKNEELNLFESSQINLYKLKEQDRSLISNSNQDSESATSSKKILSLEKIQQSPAIQNLDRVSNNNDELEKSVQKPQSKFKTNINSPVSSKSFQGPYNQKPINIRQASSSSTIFNSVNLEESDASNRSKFSLISAQSLEKVLTNETFSEKSIHNLSEMKPTIDTNMSFKFERPKEERLSVSSKSKNQSDNELNENSDQNSSSKNKNLGLLSDTFNQNNIQVKGVSQDVSNLIQYLDNRVRDCDQHVKIKSQELEELKENCRTILALNVEDKKKLDDSKCTENTPENYLKDESSCHCIFCEEENSTSECSEEIPPFTGCECMKEDYYKIMQIAYNL